MGNYKVPPAEVVAFHRAHPAYTNKMVAAHFGIGKDSVRRAWLHEEPNRTPLYEKPEVKQSVEMPFEIFGDALLMADVHCPIHNYEYLRKVVLHAVALGIKTIVFCGDFWHCDQYGNYFPHQAGIGLEVEIPVGTELMEWILSNFDEAFFIRGNHDYRYVKGRKYKISFVDAMKETFEGLSDEAKAKLHFSNLDHCLLHPSVAVGDGGWYICHPEQYSAIPLTKAIKLAAIHSMNVATAHSHHCARGFAVNGVHQALELGGFFDRSKTAYLQASSTYPKWTPGFAYYYNGKMKLESPAWSDF